jgi:hypothetical protein
VKTIKFIVILTNGLVETEYKVNAMNRTEAVILAQALAIQNARGYEIVSVSVE